MGDTRAADEAPAPHTPRSVVTANDLDVAVSRGIISAEQRDRLLVLPAGEVPASGEVAELRGGLNYVSIGYWAGSIAVLFALGWFLVDRWKSLRPAGVLAVALLYALSFAMSSAFLSRLGYRVAASLLAVLTVGMAPVVAWAVESLLGMWPQPAFRRDMFGGDVIESVRWIPVQLSMALAGLIALRKVRFGLMVLTVVIPAGLALVQLTPWLFDPDLSFRLSAWMALFAGTLMFVAAFVIDRRGTPDAEDYQGWVYLAALGFILAGLFGAMDQLRIVRHLLPIAIAGLIAIGVALRRRLFLLPATILFITYLAFLAQDVFPTAIGFMLVMLTVGALLIFGTVIVQRRFPQLIRRFAGEGVARRATRELGVVYAALALAALALIFVNVPSARHDLTRLQERRNAAFRYRVERERSDAALARRRATQEAETRRAKRP